MEHIIKNGKSEVKTIPKMQEINGPKGLEPTRYGVDTPEWEKNGRVSDF